MANTGRQATSASNIEQETMESEDPKATRSTRHQIMQRKKRMEELLRSAYSSAKDHLSHFPHYNTNGLSLFLESGRGNKLSSDLKNYIQKLLKVNMEGPYGAEWPAEEKVKRREMSSPEALYIFLEPAYQGKGLGKFLMQLVELIACNNSMGAVVLTVQKQNTSAINFYLNKLSYNISSISPSKVYQLMGVTGQEKSYEILCKTFDDEAKAVLEES
ncbi:putative transferase transcription regulator GNAT family [Helianthus annuus]|nr:putative transferase transcription regulator GNAT family [Helianthus annuus]